MRIWLGKFKSTRRRGRNWNIGVHVFEDEGIPIKDVVSTVEDSLREKFPQIEIVMSPSAEKAGTEASRE